MNENTVTVLGRRLKECGVSQADLARRLGKSQAWVSQVVAGLKRVSAEAAVSIERVTDGQISRRDLRPDLWGEVEADPGSTPSLDSAPPAEGC